MNGDLRRAANEVSKWERFLERENGFAPPKLAARYLGITTQGMHAAAERGWVRYFLVGKERYYSYTDLYTYREKRVRERIRRAVPAGTARIMDLNGTEWRSKYEPRYSPEYSAWSEFLRDNMGAFPPRVAGWYLHIDPQSVRSASERGWIRAFKVGKEHFYSRKDVLNYWCSVARKNGGSRPRPQFSETRIRGEI